MSRALYIAGILLSLASVAVADDPADGVADSATGVAIRASVSGVDAGQGYVRANLFNSADTYMRDAVASVAVAVGDEDNVKLDFGHHPTGDYAIVLYYDRDGDGRLKTGFLRIPKEKIGFSNNARGRFGPAKWQDSRFRVTETDVDLEIHLANARD